MIVAGVPLNVGVDTVPVGVTVCVCPANALPLNVGCVKLPAAMVGTPAGHEIVGCVKVPAAIVGTPAGQEIVPLGVPALTAWLMATAAEVVEVLVVMPHTPARLVPVPKVVGLMPRKFVVPEALGS